MRGKLAIAVTANFVNKNTPEEMQIREIGGLAFVFDQEFFNNLKMKCGVELENYVYYKDETHYFVMTVKKKSLLSKGILKQVCVHVCWQNVLQSSVWLYPVVVVNINLAA